MALALMALVLAAGIVVALPGAEAASPVFLKVEGKATVAVSEKNQYLVTAVGGPAEAGGNYSFAVSITGSNVADAFLSPSEGISSTGLFRFNLTAPSAATDMTITVNVTSTGSGGAKAYKAIPYYVRCVIPITISAKVVNQGSIDLDGVTVDIYGDGVKLDRRMISIAAGASTTVIYNWTESVPAGQHEIRLELDPNSQYVRFESGGVVYTKTIWVGMNDYGNVNAILIGVIVLFLFVAYIVYKRPAAKRRKSR